jgi:5-(aminomethyl)-3-furanmethanol phosphate kinase
MTERVIVKLGGATLFHPDGFAADLARVQNQDGNQQSLVIVGGGDLVEAMRTAHRIYPTLDSVGLHWRCVELLEHSLAIAREVLPLDGCISDEMDVRELLARKPSSQQLWLSVGSFYARNQIDTLPSDWRPHATWDTTTDAIAWVAGKVFLADRVVLIKQCELNPHWSLQDAAERGIVDSEIVRLAKTDPRLPVDLV